MTGADGIGRKIGALGRLAMAGAALALASCAQAPDEPAQNANLTPGPSFVSLNPCLDAILVEVASPDQILALSHYSRDPSSSSISPERAARHASTGGTVEEVLALKPDIVLASSFIAPSTRSALEELGVRVETFGSPTSVEGSLAQINELGDLSGKAARAQALIDEIEAALPDDRQPETALLLWQPGQIVPGETTLIAELLTRNGFVSHSKALGLGQADHVTLERILADPPEILLVAGDSRGQLHPLLEKLGETRVESFDPRLLYCGGRTIIDVQARLDLLREGPAS